MDQAPDGSFRRPKWPKRLGLTQSQTFDSVGFYVVAYEGSKTWQHLMLFGIILTVLALCMFPAWPMCIKLAVWYVTVSFLSFILLLVFGRLILYAFFWFFGIEFWLLPNLFNDDAGIVESFLPSHSFERRNDDWIMFAARIFCAILAAAGFHQLSQTHSVYDVGNLARQSFIDVIDWGHHKLSNVPANPQLYPSLSDIQAQDDAEAAETTTTPLPSEVLEVEDEGAVEEDYSCLTKCGFSSFEQLMESQCLMQCDCMQGVVASSCFAECPPDTQRALDEAQLDACNEEQERREKRHKHHPKAKEEEL
eukprot:GHVT01025730.1.p1 GENE.GHVT01025730.1~~GHVT01025730.1.p1  ORF type:complete len:307 (+),score=68.53 GHVT01025730.1:1124-2044(+)